jgi:hypothetical protein
MHSRPRSTLHVIACGLHCSGNGGDRRRPVVPRPSRRRGVLTSQPNPRVPSGRPRPVSTGVLTTQPNPRVPSGRPRPVSTGVLTSQPNPRVPSGRPRPVSTDWACRAGLGGVSAPPSAPGTHGPVKPTQSVPVGTDRRRSKAKRSKAKRSKAKQSKAKQSKAGRSMPCATVCRRCEVPNKNLHEFRGRLTLHGHTAVGDTLPEKPVRTLCSVISDRRARTNHGFAHCAAWDTVLC